MAEQEKGDGEIKHISIQTIQTEAEGKKGKKQNMNGNSSTWDKSKPCKNMYIWRLKIRDEQKTSCK